MKIDVTDNDGTPPCIGELRLFAPAPPGAVPDRGADLSFEPQEEQAGAHFTDDGVPGTPLSILNDHGLNYVRLRLWVDPPPGYSDLASDLRMARRIKAAGDKLYLDIHYSDFWADPQHQDIPAAWQGQDLSQLTTTVQNYTHQVIGAFAAQGTPVDMVSIGNEIRNGILWPVGQVDWTADTGWDNLTTLLKAGVAGARAANPRGHKLLVMLHFDEGGNNADSVRFYDHMVAGGVPFDVIGLSYYPFFHGPLADMRANVDDLATRYGKPIVIAESQYPWTLAGGDSTGNFVWEASQLSDGYPATPGGQLSFYNDMLSILAQVPNGLGMGLFYWEPEWIPGVGWEPGAGTPNDNLTLFSFTGQALPSVGLFQSPLAVCARLRPVGAALRGARRREHGIDVQLTPPASRSHMLHPHTCESLTITDSRHTICLDASVGNDVLAGAVCAALLAGCGSSHQIASTTTSPPLPPRRRRLRPRRPRLLRRRGPGAANPPAGIAGRLLTTMSCRASPQVPGGEHERTELGHRRAAPAEPARRRVRQADAAWLHPGSARGPDDGQHPRPVARRAVPLR